MNKALDNFMKYLEEADDEQIKKDLIELGIEDWEDEVLLEDDYIMEFKSSSIVISTIEVEGYDFFNENGITFLGEAA